MATANRKARKAAGVKFVATPKVGTPVVERAQFNTQVMGVPGTKNAGRPVNRSSKKLERALADRGIEKES